MDDSNDEALVTNWVFVEEVDIAEEAFAINASKEFNEVDNLKQCDSIDSDVESDGVSIISSWSSSQESPHLDSETMIDYDEDREIDPKIQQISLTKQLQDVENNEEFFEDIKVFQSNMEIEEQEDELNTQVDVSIKVVFLILIS